MGRFLGMLLLGILGASLLENILAGKKRDVNGQRHKLTYLDKE